jgi:hypothetical protein
MKRVLLIILCAVSIEVFPCSIFKYSIGNSYYFCGNEDWTAKDPAIMTIPRKKNEYGVIIFGWKSFLPNYPQAGINSEGLCFDWATVPAQKYTFEAGKNDLSINSTIDILKTCATVEDVIQYLAKYNFSHLAEEHIIFSDRTGKSCVIEYTKGEKRVLIETGKAQFITNFNLTDKENGWYPCKRFSILENTILKNNIDSDQLPGILDSVHQEGAYPTIYSYIFDLKKLTIKVFYNHNYLTHKEYKIANLISKSQVISIK